MRGFLHDLNDILKPIKAMWTSRFPKFFLPLLLLFFIMYKSGYLNLPFYWDEAWSYATAIFEMHENGLAILPGDANVDLTRGHPLFFYFLSALWIRIFGTSLTVIHILPLIISCLLLIVLYQFCRHYFNNTVAIIAVSCFTLQSVFLAQSAMLLPEVLLALLTLSSIYAYLQKRWLLYVLSGSLLVLSKETGIILIAATLLDKLLFDPIPAPKHKTPLRSRITELLFICIPAFIFIAYLICQKIRLDWWLYPEHLAMITSQGTELIPKIGLFFSKLFLQNGRNIFLVTSIICLSGLIYTKRLTDKEKHFMLFAFLYILFYGMFSVFNFFTTRYILSVLPVYIIAGSVAVSSFLVNRKTIRTLVVTGLVVLFAYQTWFVLLNESDVSISYRDTVLMQKELVHYAGKNNWNDKLIYSAFLMQYYLSNPHLGYLNDQTDPFYNVKNLPGLPYDLYIFCSNEKDPFYEKASGNDNYFLVKRFERNKAWAEIYAPRQNVDHTHMDNK